LQRGETNAIIYTAARLCWEVPADVALTKSPIVFMTSVREITYTSEFVE
jgi:hypothetical protein